MSAPESVLVVGASAAGLSTAEALRRKGYEGRLTLLGAEPHLPYDRPPLSKQVLSGAWPPERARLRPEEVLDGLDAELVLGEAAAGLEAENRTVRTDAGRTLRADAVVIATGIRPRSLPGTAGLSGVHRLRTVDDALALRAGLGLAQRLVVVGDGVLGAEIAATATGLCPEVVLVGPQAAPMEAQIGPEVAKALAERHTEGGVTVRPGVGVSHLVGQDGRVTGVTLDSGEILDADLVLVSIGSVPVTEWLTGSALTIADGVVCDATCRTAEGIWAVGDVARWYHQGLGRSIRLENRTNATEQGAAVAGNILGEERAYTPIPYFWTDQFDARIQVFGTIGAESELELVEGDLAGRRCTARYRSDGGVTAVVGWNMPKQVRRLRQELVDACVRNIRVPAG